MTTAARRSPPQSGPPLGVLAVVCTALFLAGLVLSVAIAGGAVYPSPFDPAVDAPAYFRDHRPAVQVGALLQFAAAIPLAIYAATASARLNRLGIRAPGATIALTGGILAAAFLALSAMVGWVLSRPETTQAPGLAAVLHDLAFITGGPGHVVPLGLLVAGIAVPGLLARLLPRWLAASGLVIALLAELTTLTLLLTGMSFLLPVARFTGLAWLVAAGFLLPRRRARS